MEYLVFGRDKSYFEKQKPSDSSQKHQRYKVCILLNAETIEQRLTLHSTFHVNQNKKKQTKPLNVPFTLIQGGLVQETLVVTFAKDQRSNPIIEHSGQSTPRRWKIRRTDGMEWQ